MWKAVLILVLSAVAAYLLCGPSSPVRMAAGAIVAVLAGAIFGYALGEDR